MNQLIIVNKPELLINNTKLTHKITNIFAFEYNEKDKEVAIYENYIQWKNQTPAFFICKVISIAYSEEED